MTVNMRSLAILMIAGGLALGEAVVDTGLAARLASGLSVLGEFQSPLPGLTAFTRTRCPSCGRDDARRETDTMDTFMCSSWYWFRYLSPAFDTAPFDPEEAAYWLPVDVYTGGAEHAVMHLLYARFFIKAIRDIGLIDFDEPFTRLFNQGIIIREHQKMSKSRGNVITPDDLVDELGADTVRTYLMFLGPWDQGGDWSDTGISGMSRWLNRLWNMITDPYEEQSINEKTKTGYIAHPDFKDL